MAAGGKGRNPFRTGELFYGRDKDLRRLEDLLSQGQSMLLIGGRRAGKTTLSRRLTTGQLERTLVLTDVTGWDLNSMPSSLGALREAIEGVPPATYATADRNDITQSLDAVAPLTLVIDEADLLLLADWGPAFFHYLRWLDDFRLRNRISFLLVGGPVLVLFKDPDDKGSPPLNTAEPHYLSPLDRPAVADLAKLAGEAEHCGDIFTRCGGHAWLTTRLLAEIWDGASLEDAMESISEGSIGAFESWERQLGPLGRELVRRLPPDGIPHAAMNSQPWIRYRRVAPFGRSIGMLRRDNGRVMPGPQLFLDWFAEAAPSEQVWDLAISYASQDVDLAREIYGQLKTEFEVFFAPAQQAPLWGSDLNKALPNTYGVQSRFVLVLSTKNYIDHYWTMVEFNAAAQAQTPILMLDMGALPDDLPPGIVYRGSSPSELVGLMKALRDKLAAHHQPT
jgi:hypothetical protein